MNRLYLIPALGLAAFLLGAPTHAHAQAAPPLGTAAPFSVLAGSAVTNTGTSVVTGDVGVSPGSSITGFPPGVVIGGALHSNDAVAVLAQSDLTIAYNNVAAAPCTLDLTGQDLGGMILTPGVYCFSSSAQLTGLLRLNAQGDPAAVFLFKIGSTLTTASGATVQVFNGGVNCNVFWQVGSSATLGTSSVFTGNILALTSITVTNSVTVHGRALARNGAVTLDNDTFTRPTCAPKNASDSSGTTPGGSGTGTIPGTVAGTTSGAGSGTAPGGGTGTGTVTGTVTGTGTGTIPGVSTGSTPGGGTGTTPGGGTGKTPGGGTGTTPSAYGPGVPGVVGPPRTGADPLGKG